MPVAQLPDEVRRLVQRVALSMLAEPSVLAPIARAVGAGADDRFGAEPSIGDAIGMAARENALHWMRAMSVDPSVPVEPTMSSRVVAIAREGSRWGVTSTLRHAYRAGERATLSTFMSGALELTADRELLVAVLEHVAGSLAHFVDATVESLLSILEQERSSLSGDNQIRQLEMVNRILGGTPPSSEEIRVTLAYPLAASHLCVIISAPPRLADRARLVEMATTVYRLTDPAHRLLVHASTSSLWLWVTPRRRPTRAEIEQALSRYPHSRLSFGPTGSGEDGFRRSHQGALASQRSIQDHGPHRVVLHTDVAAVLLLAKDPAGMREFVDATLGDLAVASPELQQTLRIYLHERYNASQTARILFAHRNTVLQRVQRAESLLPPDSLGHGTNVCLALDAVYWLDLRLE